MGLEQLRRCSRASLLELRLSLCALCEGTLGWITGCGWINAVKSAWTSIDAFPTLAVLASDVRAAAADAAHAPCPPARLPACPPARLPACLACSP